MFRIQVLTALLVALLSLSPETAPAEPTFVDSNPDTTMSATPAPASLGTSGAEIETGRAGGPSVSWDVSLVSKYIWQGLDFGGGKAGLQPEVVLGYGAFSGTLWMHHNLARGVPTEYDLVLLWNLEEDAYAASAGYSYFRYPHSDGAAPSQEVQAGLSLSTFLNPSVNIHYDFVEGKGLYGTGGLSHSWETRPLPLTLGVEGYYHDRYYGMTGCPSISFLGETAVSFASFTVTPSVSYYATWHNGDFRGESAVPSTWLFSLNIAQSF